MPGETSIALHSKVRYWRCDIKGAPHGKLQGKTVAIKDNTAVSGIPMMNGSHTLEGFVPDVDASVVSRILDAVGHIVGKAVCEDLRPSGGSCTSVTGPVLNPYDKTRMVKRLVFGICSFGKAKLATFRIEHAFFKTLRPSAHAQFFRSQLELQSKGISIGQALSGKCIVFYS